VLAPLVLIASTFSAPGFMLELGSNYSVSSATEGRGNVLLPEYDLGLARRRLS
jgi:hypothetical protein